MQYAGSEALKTDLTRTGKRTFTGMLRDLKTAIVRYYKNNFCDGRRQDAIDLGTIHILRQHIFGHFAPPPIPYLLNTYIFGFYVLISYVVPIFIKAGMK